MHDAIAIKKRPYSLQILWFKLKICWHLKEPKVNPILEWLKNLGELIPKLNGPWLF
jgi:hypothetical protein